MRRIFSLLLLCVAVSGCASTGDKPGLFDEAKKDWNGDNMRMRSDSSNLTTSGDFMMMRASK